MHIKIYFNDKPLFLCDQISPELDPFLHHDDAVFIDEFSPQAVKSMIHEMQLEKIHAGIFLHADLDALKKAFWKKFTIIKAGGGLVENKKHEVLFISRRGRWDLPKGKLDEGETMEQCALREVREETGLADIKLQAFLLATYHTYHENGRFILKETYWYTMQIKREQHLIPQAEEDITDVKWAGKEELTELLKNTFPSIIDVMNASGRLATS